MNVIITNKQKDKLSNLDIDIIKEINGEYQSSEIVEMFKNFFFNKMILDVSALKNYTDIKAYQDLAVGLDANKIIFFLPEGTEVCTSSFLSKLISIGIYNFTTNVSGVKYLLNHNNSYKDVAHIQQISNLSTTISNKINSGNKIIGIRNVTDHAGATTLIYILKKELVAEFGDNIVAIEVNKTDFKYFNDANMISTSTINLNSTLKKYQNALAILIDLNDYPDDSSCSDVLYLLEPSTIKLNKLIRKNKNIFNHLKGKKIVLNKSLLTNKDITDFEYESNSEVFYNMPPLDDRKSNNIIKDFLSRIGLLENKEKKDEPTKIFGLFKR